MRLPWAASRVIPLASVAVATIAAVGGASSAVPEADEIAFTRTVRGTTAIYVMTRNGRRQRPLVRPAHPLVSAAAWSARTGWIAFQAAGAVWIMRPFARQIRRIASTRGTPAWSRDGRFVATLPLLATQGPAVIVHEVASGRRRRLSTAGVDFIQSVSWSPSGTQLALGVEGAVLIIDARSGRRLRRIRARAGHTEPAWSPDGRSIAFVGEDTDGVSNLYLSRPDGTGRRLVVDEGNAPAWSSDGTKLAFKRLGELVVGDRDGRNARVLSDETGDSVPTWSPDSKTVLLTEFGRLLAVDTDRGSTRVVMEGAADVEPSGFAGGSRVGFVRESAEAVRRLIVADRSGRTRTYDSDCRYQVSWTRSGRRVACQTSGILVATLGEPARKIIHTSGADSAAEPSWSPNERQLTYVLTAQPYQLRVYSFATRKSRRIKLPPALTKLAQPAWSPNGRSIAFTAGRTCKRRTRCTNGVYVHDLADGRTRRLTSQGETPTWSGDSRSLAFSSRRDGDWEIYTVRADGSRLRKLTNNTTTDYDPSWG